MVHRYDIENIVLGLRSVKRMLDLAYLEQCQISILRLEIAMTSIVRFDVL